MMCAIGKGCVGPGTVLGAFAPAKHPNGVVPVTVFTLQVRYTRSNRPKVTSQRRSRTQSEPISAARLRQGATL